MEEIFLWQFVDNYLQSSRRTVQGAPFKVRRVFWNLEKRIWTLKEVWLTCKVQNYVMFWNIYSFRYSDLSSRLSWSINISDKFRGKNSVFQHYCMSSLYFQRNSVLLRALVRPKNNDVGSLASTSPLTLWFPVRMFDYNLCQSSGTGNIVNGVPIEISVKFSKFLPLSAWRQIIFDIGTYNFLKKLFLENGSQIVPS